MIPTQQLNDFKHQFFQWKWTILNQSPNQEHPRLQLNRPRLEWYKPNPKKHEWRDTWMNFKQVKCNLWYTLNEIKQFHYMKCFIQKPNPTLVWYTTFQVETRANAWLIDFKQSNWKWATFEGCQVRQKKTKANTFKMNVFGLWDNVLGSLFDKNIVSFVYQVWITKMVGLNLESNVFVPQR